MAQQITAPTRRERQGGLKSVVGPFVEESRLGGPAGSDFGWEDSGCVTAASETRAGCYDQTDDDTLDADKLSGGVQIRTIPTDPFARYVGVECWIGGDADGMSFAEQARTNLEAIEDREVEAMIVAWASGATETEADTLVAAIAAAEAHADASYVGAPVLIMSRSDVELAAAAGALEWRDGRLSTKANNSWVIGTFAVTPGTVYVTGALGVYASPIIARDSLQHTANRARALAERIYAFGVDCDYRHAVTVTDTP